MPENRKTTGFTLVEAILAGALFLMISLSLVSAVLYGQEGAALAGKRARALYLAEEGIEAVRNIQEQAFANLTPGTYGLSTTANSWVLAGASDTIDIFNRQITIANIDAQKKTVNVVINWAQNLQRAGTISLSTTLTNWRALTIGNWANPNTLAASIDLPGNTDGWRVDVVGNYAYVARAANPSNFHIIDITNPASPVLLSTTNIAGNPQDVTVAGNYAYIATTNNTGELAVYNITNPAAPTLAGSYNAAGNEDGLAVSVVGNMAYLGRVSGTDPEFYALNITNPAAIASLGSLQLSNNINEIAISGNHAFIASANTAQELQVVDITNPAAMSQLASYNAAGNGAGNDVIIAGNLLALALSTNSVALLNITTPTAPALYSSVAIGGIANGISFGNNDTYLFVASANATAELQVFDVTNPAVTTLVGNYNAAASANDVFYDSISDRAYLTDTNNATEFLVVAP
ncbi:MAG TPA: hypothetical protein PKI61_02290 [bacterium]|nr:hypothetical protein [bacterium]HPT30004.1 hypothetical protein [bacterium]